MGDGRGGEGMSKFRGLERRVESGEAQVEAHDRGRPRTLKDKISALDADPRDAELAQLRRKLGKATPADADQK